VAKPRINYGQLRRFYPQPLKSSLLTALRSLHSILKASPQIRHPAVVFFCHPFCKSTHNWHIAFSRTSKKAISHPPHKKQKGVCTPTTSAVQLAPEKKQPKAT